MNKQEAQEIAQKECEARGWSLGQPVKISGGLFHYEVWGFADRKGGNVIIRIRKWDGKIVRACMTPM